MTVNGMQFVHVPFQMITMTKSLAASFTLKQFEVEMYRIDVSD